MKGQCLGGAVSVDATAARDALAACHCDMCRRWTSSILMTIPAEARSLQVSGPVRTFRSSDWAERAFCEVCGSSLWYRVTAPGQLHGQTQLAARLFDNAAGARLKLEVYSDKKPGGYAFEGTHPRMTEAEVVAAYAPSVSERPA